MGDNGNHDEYLSVANYYDSKQDYARAVRSLLTPPPNLLYIFIPLSLSFYINDAIVMLKKN